MRPPSLITVAEPTTPIQQSTNARSQDPGSPWCWLKPFSDDSMHDRKVKKTKNERRRKERGKIKKKTKRGLGGKMRGKQGGREALGSIPRPLTPTFRTEGFQLPLCVDTISWSLRSLLYERQPGAELGILSPCPARDEQLFVDNSQVSFSHPLILLPAPSLVIKRMSAPNS